MAARMRVTSFMGGIQPIQTSGGAPAPGSGSGRGLREHRARRAGRADGPFPSPGATAEYTTRWATNHRFLWRPWRAGMGVRPADLTRPAGGGTPLHRAYAAYNLDQARGLTHLKGASSSLATAITPGTCGEL